MGVNHLWKLSGSDSGGWQIFLLIGSYESNPREEVFYFHEEKKDIQISAK